MYHLRLKGTHYEMGQKRGSIFKKCGITFPLHLDKYQLAHGTKSETILRSFFPEVCEEVKGVTDALGISYIEFISWMLCMGCCMYNLESNIPVEVRGCTAFAVTDGINILYGRNNDLPPFLKAGSKSEIYKPSTGYSFNLTTSSFINGEEGINEKHLAVAMTFVLTKLSDIKPGFNSCFIVRYLLERSASTKEAIELLMNLPVSSNCNIILCDSTGEMVVVECSKDEKRIRKPIEKNNLRFICTVNNFTSNEMQKYDYSDGNEYDSKLRYQNVINAFSNYSGTDLIDYSERLLKGEFGFMCDYPKNINFDTVWSSVFNLQTLEMFRAEGNPKKTKYIFDDRLVKKAQK